MPESSNLAYLSTENRKNRGKVVEEPKKDNELVPKPRLDAEGRVIHRCGGGTTGRFAGERQTTFIVIEGLHFHFFTGITPPGCGKL
jgi:hypothetical protein